METSKLFHSQIIAWRASFPIPITRLLSLWQLTLSSYILKLPTTDPLRTLTSKCNMILRQYELSLSLPVCSPSKPEELLVLLRLHELFNALLPLLHHGRRLRPLVYFPYEPAKLLAKGVLVW